ncbi:MAG TPA: polysaccharide deacetylase family protein [Dongiaceae bacterium]|nr:polysaccharide deacetylase family protein [Dongiaceae bacterium]
MTRVVLFFLACCVSASATNYYVSSSGGSDSNPGTSPAAAWKTFSAAGNHVNSGSFNPGDVIYLKRGDVWNEQLIPPSSGAAGNPISFDAYGSGPAPVITAAAAITGWQYVSGNVWKSTASGLVSGMGAATTVDVVQFGSVYGRHQPYGSGCAGSIAGKYDWCLVGLSVYVYSGNSSTPPASDGSIIAYVDSNSGLAMISVVDKSWITFQHIKVQGFSYTGVSVTGASDNIVFANMESDGMVPYGTTPHGFYVSASAGHGANIQFVNDDAHLNYDGYRISAAAGVTLTNCRGYANRDAGLRDATSGSVSPVTYSYSHFYGNNVAQFLTTDVVGGSAVPVAGNGNIPSTIAPVVNNFGAYPARLSFTVDDVGSAPGTEGYINSFVGLFSARGIHFNVAVVPSYAVDWASVNSWYASGNEIDSHSWSHQYYTTSTNPCGTAPCTPPFPNAPAMSIQYTGAGTAATLTISGNRLSTTVTGVPADNIASIDLTIAPYNTRQGLHDYLAGLAHYAVSDPTTPMARPNTHTANLLSVSNQDIKRAAFTLLYDQTKLLPDEMTSSKNALQANVTGLNASVLVYPDGLQDPTAEADAVAAGYTAARGSLAMKGQDNSTGSANSLYSNGVNVQNITSLGLMEPIHGATQAQINQMAVSLAFRAAAWGVPYGLFTHFGTRGDSTPDISNTELGWLLDAITASGGVWLTNAGLASAITSAPAQQLAGSTRYLQPAGRAVDLAIAQANSPTVGRGAVTAYPIDINGMDRLKLGAWDIGARAYLSQRYGTGAGSGQTYIGEGAPTAPMANYQAYTGQDIVQWPSPVPDVGSYTSTANNLTNAIYDTSYLGHGASYCGVSGDTSVHQPTSYDNFAAPSLGQSYVDPQFGCQITRLTDAIGNPGSQTCSGGTCQARLFYPLVAPDNADHTLLHTVLNGLPAIVAGPDSAAAPPGTIIVKQSSFPTANLTSQSFVVWDRVNPLVFYYTATNQFVMGKVTGLPGCAATSSCTITSTTLATLSNYTAISLAADEDISEDGLHYWVMAHSNATDTGTGSITDGGCSSAALTCDLMLGTLNASGGNATSLTLAAPIITNNFWHKVQAGLANRVQVEALGGANVFSEYNPDGSTYQTLVTSHHDFLHSPSTNKELLVGAWNSGSSTLNTCAHHNGLGAVDTSTGTMLSCLLETYLPGTSTYGIPPGQAPASHVSSRDLNGEWAIFSAASYAAGSCPNATNPYCEQGVGVSTSMNNWGLYDGEIDAINPATGAILRLAHHRSRTGAGYWAAVNGTISRDGKYIYFASNFNSCPTSGGCGSQTSTSDPNYTDVYVIKFRTVAGQGSATLSPAVRCTDTNTEPTVNYGKQHTAGLGGSGSAILWNANSMLLRVNGGTSGEMIPFDPVNMVCGKAITKDHDLTNPGSATAVAQFDGGQFDLTDPTVWYQSNSAQDGANHLQYTRYKFDLDTYNYTAGPVMADFHYGMPLNGAGGVQEWQPNHRYNYGDYVYHTLSASEYFPWSASTAYAQGDLIVSGPTNNPSGCAFKATVAGTSGTTEPNWTLSYTAGQCDGHAFSGDGAVSWSAISAPPVFIYQLTGPTSGGMSGASTPAFVATKGHPDQFSTVSDNGLTWTTLTPNMQTDPNWNTGRNVDRTATKFLMVSSTTTYGYPGMYVNDNGSQNTGIWAMEYEAGRNRYHLFNTATGIMSDDVCIGGSNYNCAGGTWQWQTLGHADAMNNGCSFGLHATISTLDGDYVNLGGNNQQLGGCTGYGFGSIVWRPNQTPFDPTTQALWTLQGFNHIAAMDHGFVDLSSSVYGDSTGAWNVYYPGATVNQAPLITWQIAPCSSGKQADGTFQPPACSHGQVVDNHISGAYNPNGSDTFPVCGSIYNYATLSPIEFDAYQGEVMCQTTYPAWSDPDSPDARQKQWRFTHTFGTGSSGTFDVQFQISETSQDGRFVAWSSDWNSQLGSTSGAAPSLPVANANVTCKGGYPWLANHSYAYGELIHPLQGTGGAGTVFDVYQLVTAAGGVSGTTQPGFAKNGVVGSQVTDNGLTWQDVGVGDCRGEVFVVKLDTPTQAVNADFFGTHYNLTSSAFPDANFPQGFPIVRLWDTTTGWADMQTNANCTNTQMSGCNFSRLDTWLSKFGPSEQAILTLAKVPNFIASNPTDANCGYTAALGNPNGSCTPPTDLNCDGTGTDATWIQFLTAMWNHLKGAGTADQITYLEIWNEFNINTYWDNAYISNTRCVGVNNAVQKMLVRMTQDAQCVTQGKNCNGNGTYPQTGMHPATLMMNTPPSYPGAITSLLASGVGNYVDVISTHGYLSATNCTAPSNSTCAIPEGIDSALTTLKSNLASYGLSSKPIVISEFSWGSNSGTSDPQYEQAFVSRYYTLAAQQGVMSAEWYLLASNSNCGAGPVLEYQGTMCPGGAAMNVIEGWLRGATFLQSSYTKTSRNDCAAGSNVYEFPLRFANGSLGRVVFYDGIANTASCSYTVPPGFGHYADMSGAVRAVSSGSILLDNRAILLTAQ